MSSREYKRGYGRGYVTGRRNFWPEHIPPVPPDPVIEKLVLALKNLRNGVDSELAKFDPDDPIEKSLGPLVDEATAALIAVGDYADMIQDED